LGVNLFGIFKHIKNILYLSLILLFVLACQRQEIVKTHGISYLEKRGKLIIVNESNKNDIVNIFGQPSTKGMTNDNVWIYIERTMTRGKMLKLGKNLLSKNNVLVLEFNKYGVLKKKEFYNIENMKKLSFAEEITENEIRKENFVYSFLSSVRQKMQQKKKTSQ
tara:strand:- start:720 stop:1211 length:492 start_codon:yes stop_codon:yes gene_type:complete